MLALYDDAATVASAALKLLPLDPAVTVGWLADLAPSIGARRAPDRQDDGPLPAPAAVAIELAAPSTSSRGSASLPAERALRIGVGGPVGSGKSSLIAAVCGALAGELRSASSPTTSTRPRTPTSCAPPACCPAERITAVQTGGCPHTAIRDDISANLEAVEELEAATGPLDIVFVESGGDNLTAIFSPALADVQIFVIDVAGGDDIPRKGGPGIARADLLVINKTDLAPYVGADPIRMVREASDRRGELPVAAISLRTEGPHTVAAWLRGRLAEFRADGHLHSSMQGVSDHHHHDHVH